MLVGVLINLRKYVCMSASVIVTGSSDAAVIPERFGSDVSERKKTDTNLPGEMICLSV